MTSLTDDAALSVPPPATDQLTVTPLTALPYWSTVLTCMCCVTEPADTVWASPLTLERLAKAPAFAQPGQNIDVDVSSCPPTSSDLPSGIQIAR